MLRTIAWGAVALVFAACSSAPAVREVDAITYIGLAEIAERVGGRHAVEDGQGVVVTGAARFVAIAGLERVLFEGTEYRLNEPAFIAGGDLYLPRVFFDLTLAQRFAGAPREREVLTRLRTPTPPSFETVPEVAQPMPAGALAGRRVVIDPGHGGKDPGAVAPSMNEATLNLAVARHVAANLRELGVEVLLTRSDDSYISLDDRVAVASSGRADIFVSIHANAFQDGSVEGIEVYHKSEPDASPLVNASRDLAARILEAMLSATGARSRGVKRDERGLRVLRKGEVPAVLIEMGYLTNADERSRLQDAAYQEQLAQGIVAGIREYLSQTPAALN